MHAERRYSQLRHWLNGPCLTELTLQRRVIFEELYESIFKAAEVAIKRQATRAIERLLAYLTQLHYANFFAANGGRDIPAQMTILGDITLDLHIRPAPQRLPKEEFCSDLSEATRTINDTFGLLDRLRAAARNTELGRHLTPD